MEAKKIKKALECCAGAVIFCRDGCRQKVAKDALALIISQEQRIKELTEENEAWQKQLISTEEKASKAYYELACEVEDLRVENERLRAELEQRPPKLIITKLPKKENENV